MKKDSVSGISIVGNREFDCTIMTDLNKKSIHKINSSFWDTEGGEVLGNTSLPLGEGTLALADRKISTYVNALAKAGFVIEQMIEESDDEIMKNNDSNFAKKAKMLPLTFVVKARKL